ncbi:MAG: FkbM family methyltransferase [bacterium]
MSFLNKAGLLLWSLMIIFYKRLRLKIPPIKIFLKKTGTNAIIYDGTDLATLMEIFLYEEYKIPNDRIVNRILDLGANTGYTSLYFASIFKQAEIVSVEPDLENIDKISNNTKELSARIIVEPSAVAASTGKINFYRNFKTSISGSTVLRDKMAEMISVPALTLTDLEKKYGSFDLVKFDIEGGEWEAILPDGLTHQPDLWIGEYHEDLVKKPSSDFAKRFTGYEYIFQKIAKNRSIVIFKKQQ